MKTPASWTAMTASSNASIRQHFLARDRARTNRLSAGHDGQNLRNDA